MPFTLINARPSPFGRKVAIALIEKGLEYNVQYAGLCCVIELGGFLG